MNKQESLVLKGVAILFMLFLHLFSIESITVEKCHNLIWIGDHPLAFVLSRATSPVSLYLLLSGYGLYVSKHNDLRTRIVRVLKLLIYCWFVTTLFVFIGHFMVPDKYPGSIQKIFDNYSTLWPTYNLSYWFLCPYLILMFCSPYLFSLFNKFRCRYVVASTIIINTLTSYYISRIGYGDWIQYRVLYNLFLSVHIMMSFSIGYALARTGILRRFRLSSAKSIICMVCLIAFRCCFDTGVFHFIYTVLFVFLFLHISRPTWLDKLLMDLGKENLGMWMVHLWFSKILFQDIIYAPKVPFLIYILLVVVTYFSSKFFSFLLRPAYSFLNNLINPQE